MRRLFGRDTRSGSHELEALNTADKDGPLVSAPVPWWAASDARAATSGGRSVCGTVFLITCVVLSALVVAAGGIVTGAGAYWLHAVLSIHLQHCAIAMITAIVPVTVGPVLLVAGVLILTSLCCLCPNYCRGRGKYADHGHVPRRMLQLVGPLLLLLIGVVLATVILFLSSAAHQAPDLTKDYGGIAGLAGPVHITRDDDGIPHIRAQSRTDAVFGQGFAHAQDRLWQLEFVRLAAQGRLAEHLGGAALKMDKQTRTLGFVPAAERMCQNVSPETAALMQSYVDGINFYLQHAKQRPPEFMFMSRRLLFYHEPQPWQRDHVCLYALILMWQLTGNLRQEMQRFNIFWKTDRSYADVQELFTNQTNITGTVLNAQEMGLSEADAVNARAREAADTVLEARMYDTVIAAMRPSAATPATARSMHSEDVAEETMGEEDLPCGPCGSGGRPSTEWDIMDLLHDRASNAWAARTSGSATTAAVGASDPHLGLTVPSVWYAAHLTYPLNATADFDAIGVGLPGIPGVHIGKTTFASWGITMSTVDLLDLFIITPSPTAPATHYVVNGTAVPFTSHTETIRVRFGSDVTITVRNTLYGPVVTDILDLPAAVTFALFFQPFRNDTGSPDGVMCLNDPTVTTAQMVRDRCLSKLIGPGFSIPIEDHHGNLAYGITGAHPWRRPGHTGRVPTLGNGSYDYLGFIPYAELPTLLVPAAVSTAQPRFIAAANQKVYPDGYRYSLGYDYAYPYRGRRIQELLAANPTRLSDATFHTTVQTDIRSNAAEEWLALLNATDLPEAAAFRAAVATDAAAQEWWSRLLQWDRHMPIGSVEGAFFWLFLRRLHQSPRDAIIAVNSGDYWGNTQYAQRQILSPSPLMTYWCRRFVSGATGCGDMAGRVFLQATAAFRGQQWGRDLNQVLLQHLMAHNTILACLFERSFEKDGDDSTIDVADFSMGGNMQVPVASSMRQIYDWARPDTIRFAFPSGNSGYIFSRWYTNFMGRYQADVYTNITAVAASTLVNAQSPTSQQLSP